MKGTFIFFISFLGIAIPAFATSGSNTPVVAVVDNVKDKLNTIHLLKRDYASGNDVRSETLMRALGSPEFLVNTEVAQNLHDAIQKVEELRNAILKDEHAKKPDVQVVDKKNVTNPDTVVDFLHDIYRFATTLGSKIEEWKEEKSKVDNSKFVTNMAVGPAAGWFMNQGYTEAELNNTSLDALKPKVNEITGKDKAVYKVLRGYATYYMSQKPTNLGERLSWLLMFAGSTNNTEMVETLKTRVNGKLAGKGEEFVENVKALDGHNGPLMNLMGTGSGGGLYPVATLHMKPGNFADPTATKYWGILSHVCKYTDAELKQIANMLKGKAMITQHERDFIAYLKAKGFNVEYVSAHSKILSDNINAVIAKEKPLAKVCKIVEDYNRINPPTGEDEGHVSDTEIQDFNDFISNEGNQGTQQQSDESTSSTLSGSGSSSFATLDIAALVVATIAMVL